MKQFLIIFLVLLAFSSKPVKCQVDSIDNAWAVRDTQNLKVTLFDTDDLFHISLRFDISRYKKYKSDVDYLSAILTYNTGNSDSISKKIKVRARGNIRRTSICDFPPLLLNFKMKDNDGTEFSGINKLKIVPYCRLGYEDYVLREYLVYKLYNVLTDYSFRVRLFKINYINTAKPGRSFDQFAFAIEPVGLLEKRTNSFVVKSPTFTQRYIRQEVMDRFAVFSYMIGNTDWSVPNQHNVLVMFQFVTDDPRVGVAVPFDFDMSGFVNASYAVPLETLPIKSVRERLYIGYCRDEDNFRKVLQEFREKKDELYRVIEEFPYLKADSKKDLKKYMDSFFRDINRGDVFIKKLLQDCAWFEQQAGLRGR